MNIERQTYNLLELLGDVGGLYDGLRISFANLLAPLVAFAVKIEVVTRVVYLMTRSAPNKRFRISNYNWPSRQYNKLLSRAENKVEKQLDLVKFIT